MRCTTAENKTGASPLSGKIICIDAGHGGTANTDAYRVGPSGEREEWINLRVAKLLQPLLEAEGARVVMTRTEDKEVGLEERAQLARDQESDLFLSIHHNATADTAVNFPIIYYHANASENSGGVALAKQIARQLLPALFGEDTLVSIASDHTIFPEGGARVLRSTYGIPGVLAEASFFTNPSEEQRLKQAAYNQQEAEAYHQALVAFFQEGNTTIKQQNSLVTLPPYAVLQEAERMRPEVRRWLQDYQQGKEWYAAGQLDSAYVLLSRSARNFPDSYVAGDAHRLRAEILQQIDSTQAAARAFLRAREYYVNEPVHQQEP